MIICWTWTWTNNGNYALLNEISLLLIGSVGKFNQAHHFTGGMGSFFENASRFWYLGDNLFSVVYQPAVLQRVYQSSWFRDTCPYLIPGWNVDKLRPSHNWIVSFMTARWDLEEEKPQLLDDYKSHSRWWLTVTTTREWYDSDWMRWRLKPFST